MVFFSAGNVFLDSWIKWLHFLCYFLIYFPHLFFLPFWYEAIFFNRRCVNHLGWQPYTPDQNFILFWYNHFCICYVNNFWKNSKLFKMSETEEDMALVTTFNKHVCFPILYFLYIFLYIFLRLFSIFLLYSWFIIAFVSLSESYSGVKIEN